MLHTDTNDAKAYSKRGLTLLALNIASSRLGQQDVVSEDGATASQAMTYFSKQFIGEDFSIGADIAKIHEGEPISTGVIPLIIASIMFKPGGQDGNLLVPGEITLHQNFPNPFNPVTEIRFGLPEPADVTLTIYNIAGQEVAVVARGRFNAGYHTVEWDGSSYASGVYLYCLQSGSTVKSRKMVLLK